MRMYVRKDVAAQIWNYGVGPSPEEVVADPYEGKETKLTADVMFGLPGSEPGQFNRPRDLAVAPDGTLYVADTDNHRIQHLSRDGEVLHTWGSFADISKGPAPAGTFYEPWGSLSGQMARYTWPTPGITAFKNSPRTESLSICGVLRPGRSAGSLLGS
jgi:hypothetical protein